MEEQASPLEPELFAVKMVNEEIGGYLFLRAEAEISKGPSVPRTHRRVFVRTPGNQETDGRAILYSDTYHYPDEPTTNVYISHKVDINRFFGELDQFIFEHRGDFPELFRQEFNVWVNLEGEIVSLKAAIPFSKNIPRGENVHFVRISIPFGDISVAFTPQSINRLSDPNKLPVEMQATIFDSPLFGFDSTRTTTWSKFAARIHWASSRMPLDILNLLIERASRIQFMHESEN